jgi:hypothetical protein
MEKALYVTNSAVSARAYKSRPRRSGSFFPQGRPAAGAELAMTEIHFGQIPL